MNKKLALAALLIAFLGFNFNTFAQESTLSTEAVINQDVSPDTAKIRLYVENTGSNIEDIKQKNDKTVNDVISKIKQKLSPNESVKTIAFRVNSVYSNKEKSSLFQKYQVTNGFEVKLKDLNKVSKIIKIALDNGVTMVDRVDFSIEDGEKVCNELMTSVISMAKNRALTVAKASGSELLKIKNINPYCSLTTNYVQPRFLNSSLAKTADMASSGGSMLETINPGTISARASVNMTYYLK